MIGKDRDSIGGYDATDDDDDGSMESNESGDAEFPLRNLRVWESRPTRVVQIKADFGYPFE